VIAHRDVALLRVSDPSVLAEIRAVVPLDDYVLGWISPTEAIIDPASLRALQEGLEGRGIAALVKRANPS
jgi:hypothetical protein